MSSEPDVLDEVTPELVRRVENALAEDRTEDIRTLLAALSATGQASILEQLSEPERDKLVGILKRDLDPEALTELDEEVLEDVLEQLDSKDIAAAARDLETDDAATILEDLPEEERREVLAELPADERAEIESALAYPEDTAGRLMQRSLVKMPGRLDGRPGDRLIAARRPTCRTTSTTSSSSTRPAACAVRYRSVACCAASGRCRSSTSSTPTFPRCRRAPTRPRSPICSATRTWCPVPVVDERGRLLGVIMVDDVVDVIDEEAEEDLLKMGGVGIDDMHANPVRTARLRAVWLAVNLATAVMASLRHRPVRGRHREDRGAGRADADRGLDGRQCRHADRDRGGARAGDGRADGCQRACASSPRRPRSAASTASIFAMLMGAAVVAWYGDWRLGAVIGAAMICNLLAAALAGTLIPLGLQKFGVDPAVSSTVFLTTVTDVIGFLAFLGLATAFLL